MSNTAVNRQIVQEGLDSKKTARRQRMNEAAHEAAGRQLRVTINRLAEEHWAVMEAAEADERRQEELKEAIRMQRAEDKALEAQNVDQMTRCATRVFQSLLYAVLAAYCFINAEASAWLVIPIIGLNMIYSIVTITEYTVWNLRKKVAT